MKRIIMTIMLGLMVLAVLPATGIAQNGNNDMLMSRLERELETTDDMLRTAEEAVGLSANALAEMNLVEATTLQTFARKEYEELRGRFRGERYGLALKATRKAREKAASALAHIRTADKYEGTVLRDLERARDLLEKAREVLAESESQNLQTAYSSVESRLTQAWVFYRKGQYRPAFKLASQIQKSARKLLEAANADIRKQGVYERRLSRVRDYLDQVRSLTAECAGEDVKKLMRRAERAFDRAETAAVNNQVGAALKQLQTTRDAAAKIERACQGKENLDSRYDRQKAELDRLNEIAAESGTEHLQKIKALLVEANDQLANARTRIDSQKIESATVSLKAAQLALRQARSMLEGRP